MITVKKSMIWFTNTSALADVRPPRSPMWTSLPSVSIIIDTENPFTWFNHLTRSITVRCHSRVPWHMLRRATFMPPAASASSSSRPHVAGPIVHTSFVLRELLGPFSLSSTSIATSRCITPESTVVGCRTTGAGAFDRGNRFWKTGLTEWTDEIGLRALHA